MRLTPHQRKVMKRLRAGESICWSWTNGSYELSGGGTIREDTRMTLLKAKLIREKLPDRFTWIATEKGDGDG